MIRTTTVTIAIAALALGMSGAAQAAPTPLNAILTMDNTTGGAGGAWVRAVHASPNTPAVDVWVDGALIFSNLAFEDSTSFLEVPPGSYLVQVALAGAGAAGPFVMQTTLDLSAGTDYTVIASGLLADLTPSILTADGSGPAPGQGWVRFFHGSPDAPAVDIAITGGPVLFANVAFRESAPYLPVDAGTYDLEVRVAGTETVVLTLPDTTVPDRAAITAYATGLVADGAADRTLYLSNDRFRVDVSWASSTESSFGRPVALTEDTGYFWFFDQDNVEVIVKVLNGCAVNGSYWVFVAGLTDVEVELVVTDTLTSTPMTYTNDLGTAFAPVQDTSAFATCS